MKASSTLVASVFAASTVALSSSCSSEPHYAVTSNQVKECKNGKSSKGKEKFAPRFDGLRFIETLVTAHR